MVKIGILGAAGSMGRLIMSTALKDEDVKIIYTYDIPSCPNLGMDIGSVVGIKQQNIKITSIENMDEDFKTEKPDVIIDFTIAKATESNAYKILKHGISLVIGTTGLSSKFSADMNKIAEEKKIPMVIATNMAIGVNVVFKMVAELAKRLPGWEIEIMEAHHHRKRDAPSGTALTIAENIAKAINVNLDKVGKYGREKGPNPRKWGNEEIGIHAIRAGDIVGDHTILYAGNGERIELKHQAHSRDCFATGAIEAAKFIVKKRDAPKVYNMQEVLGLD